MNDMIDGALSGCLATVPMTLVMEVLHRRLPPSERYPLPPRQITMEVAERADVAQDLDADERLAATLLAHFGMGTAAGALYPAFRPILPGPPPLAGMTYGLLVWAGNYLGLLPALDILTLATRHPPRRTALMIAAHLVWGTALAMLAGPDRHSRGSEPRNA